MIQIKAMSTMLKGAKMSLKTKVIGCGGAGSNIVEHLKNGFGENGYIEYLTMDSSDSNKKEGIKLFQIKENTVEGKALSGSGGIRGENLEHYRPGVKEFINTELLHNYDGVIYLVFSSSGASGNILATLLLQEILPLKIPMCCVVVHDSSTKKYAESSYKTMETIFKTAVKNNCALPVVYFLNKNSNKITNDTILEEFSSIMKFHDTDNLKEIDNQDMKNFYNSIKYSSSIPAGVYSIATIKPEFVNNVIEKYEVIIGRCLTNDEDVLKNKGLEQSKHGIANDKSEHVILLLNNFDRQYDSLKKALDTYNKEIKKHSISLSEDNITDDGIVL